MNEVKTHCNTCKYSFYQMDRSQYTHRGSVLAQHCANTVYNSAAYTREMLLEDWHKGCCRFWAPRTEKKGTYT